VIRRRSAVVALVLLSLTAILLGAAVVLLARTLDRPANVFAFRGAVELLTLAFALVGGLLALRRPENPIGWVFLAASFLSGVQVFAQEYTVFALAEGNVQGARIGNWIDGFIWVPISGSIAIFVTVLFPTGRLPSRRWRWVPWIGSLGISLFTAAFIVSTDTEFGLPNPFFELSPDVVGPLFGIGSSLYLIGVLGALASLVVRFRRSRGDERQQLRWFAAAVALLGIFLTLTIVGQFLAPKVVAFGRAAAVATILSFIAIPIATGVAVLKYRLYDIDVVISRTVLFGLLIAFITAVYLGIVVGLGALVGSRGNLLLSVVATAVIAVAFQPVRARARHLANRLVYGKRATPYEVLAEFSDRVRGSYSAEDVLPEMARLVGEATGAARTDLWLRVGSELRHVGGWPPVSEGGPPLPLRSDELPAIPDADRAFAIREADEFLGAISIRTPRGELLTPAEERLLDGLSGQAGLILRNVRLVEELRASRQRLVAAQDEERRRLERNIHDGAQQQLVALSVKMRLLKALNQKDPEKASELVDQLQADSQDALENLRDLARGIYPPLLADRGLAAALEAQARKVPFPVTVEPNGIGRYSAEAEATAYFCVLEALQNAAKYAEASNAVVRLGQDDGHLVFTVTDDGRGFDPATTRPGSGLQNMADRVEAMGGSIEVSSAPGLGTTVTGRVPVSA